MPNKEPSRNDRFERRQAVFQRDLQQLLKAQVLLTDAQRKTEEKLVELAEAQRHTDERLNSLIRVVDDIIRNRKRPT